MKKTPQFRRLVAYILVCCLVLAMIPVALATNNQQDVSLREVPVTAEGLKDQTEAALEPEPPAADEMLRVIIVFNEKNLVEKGHSTLALSQNAAAMAYRNTLKSRQEMNMKQVNATLGQTLDVRYQFTIGVNGVATTVRYDQIEKIEAMEEVKAVYIENQYSPDELEPNTSTAGGMIGSYNAWADGYTGAGSRVAIIDTGLDIDHPSFDEAAFLYSLELSAARFGREVEDYDLLTAEEVARILPQLHAAERYADLTAEALYHSAKIPFGFNYVDKNLDVTHDNDTQGDHGTHVAGIATANTYVWGKDADGDVVAMRQEHGVVGVAPDAQVLPMKVFGATGGAYDSDYMAALEDAILLGCDTVNLSLGSTNVGHTYSSYDELFGSLVETDVVVTISAGNKYSHAYFNNTGVYMNLTQDTVINTVGSPGAYPNSLAVASVDNAGLTGIMADFNGVVAAYSDTYADYKMNAFVSLDTSADRSGTAYDYVFLGDPVTGTGIYGAEEDFVGQDLTGKIALISRGGGVSFFEKANRAVAAGAVATVVYNNVAGSINMAMTGYTYKNPAVSMEKSYGDAILAASAQDEAGYWGGTMTIANRIQVYEGVMGGYEPSVFSSWGAPGNLDLKPEITAPGGNIWSTTNNGTYGLMSGTSMSAPSVSGVAAVVAQYIRENGLHEQEGLTVRALSQALMMSTAHPLKEDDTVEYSPRRQGAGLVDVYNAVTTPAYLLTDDKATTDGKAKLVLGDDPERAGVYAFDFTVNNMSDEALNYVFSAAINTMAVETIDGAAYMSDTAYALSPQVKFTTDAAYGYLYDLNGDGEVNSADAEVLLKVANGSHAALSEKDMAKYDFDADGQITSADAKIYMRSLKGDTEVADVLAKSYIVAPGEAISVHAVVTLSEADRAYFAENYVNGCYVEGFIYVTDPDGMAPELSAPMLAYYGSWTDASMFDKFIQLEHASDPEAYSYVSSAEANAMIVDGYVLIANPYDATGAFMEGRTALTSSSRITYVYPTLLRNAGGTVYVEVSNAQTGEVYKTVDAGAKYGAYYYTSAAAWYNVLQSISLNWNTTDAEGNPLPEGTEVKVSVYAIPEYNYDRTTGQVVGTLGDGASWDTYFAVDDTAPEILDGTYSRNWVTGTSKLEIVAQDNRHVAAILVTNARQTEVLARHGVDQRDLGATIREEVDMTGIEANNVVVMVVDYAGNITAYELSLGGDGDSGDITDFIYANDTTNNTWLTFRPEDPGSATEVASGDIYAAEYIDGYVFTVDGQHRFCVAPVEDLEDQTYISTLNTSSLVIDMAFNYADGKLYALCTQNYLYTIDPIMGTTEQVGIIPLPAGNTLQSLACATDGTFYGITNSGMSNTSLRSHLYSFTIGEEGFAYQYIGNTGLTAVYIQSMAYDHNTGTLYHANYGFTEDFSTYEGRLVSYNTETAEPTLLAKLGNLGEYVGLFIPKKSTGMFGPSDEIRELSLSQTEVSMLKGGQVTLEVSVRPWTVVNRECEWLTSDASVATVENGVITAVGEGSCKILATSVLDPQVVATCEVTVTAVDQDLTGLVWDKEGDVWHSGFSTDALPDYTKKHSVALTEPLMAMVQAGKVTYAASYEESESGSLTSNFYTVSDSYDLTKVGTSEIGYTDMAWCENVAEGSVLATYGTNVVIVNTATGNYDGAWDLSSYTGNANLVGITWYDSQKNATSGLVTDYCLILDSNGGVWLTGFVKDAEGYKRTTPQAVAELGQGTNYGYFSSIATDGQYLYCSIWNGEQSDVILLDLATGAIANVGSFGAEVWPVVGLAVEAAEGSDSVRLIPAETDASVMTAPVAATSEALPPVFAEN